MELDSVMPKTCQSDFASALLNPDMPVPDDVTSHSSHAPQKRFGVYRNNVMVGLVGALEARFRATRKIVGEEFFRLAAKVFAAAHPPRSPLLMFFGDDFPAFLAAFEPARSVPYLADVARLEAARTRAYHAADAKPLTPAELSRVPQTALAGLRFTMHPAVEIVTSTYPIVTIWAMNAGEMDLAPVTDWHAEDALVSRPGLDVEVRGLPGGSAVFLQNLTAGEHFGSAAAAAFAATPQFDLPLNLALLFTGLIVEMTENVEAS
jgi:Putative DNA-binding domain